ncbi:MAG: bifunctional riboflavin kinase/FAD synthetase [Firmicutes bacterium]|nr:bifunctional riboflavin kinase/FAD synthetase [Bacillota bacterium]
MKLLQDVREYQPSEKSNEKSNDKSNGKFLAVTLGNFDGLHLGHQQLLKRAVQAAKENGGEALLFTFWPHPMAVLRGKAPKLLADRTEKYRLAEAAGLDYLLELPFNAEVAAETPEEFVRCYPAEGLRADLLVVGFNFRFGRGGAGTADDLQRLAAEYGIKVEIVPPYVCEDGVVSSSRIRVLLQEGQMAAANRLLGHDFVLAGEVVHGQKLGRELGYPTANVAVADEVLLPAFGVYAAWAECKDRRWPAVVNIGLRPTVGDNLTPTVEVHCLGADEDFYGRTMRVIFRQELRREQKFASLDELKAQIAEDSCRAAEILAGGV